MGYFVAVAVAVAVAAVEDVAVEGVVGVVVGVAGTSKEPVVFNLLLEVSGFPLLLLLLLVAVLLLVLLLALTLTLALALALALAFCCSWFCFAGDDRGTL